METFLQGAADGSAKGILRWYAVSHAARCMRCGRYLERMSETVVHLKEAKAGEPSQEVMDRLASGKWREI